MINNDDLDLIMNSNHNLINQLGLGSFPSSSSPLPEVTRIVNGEVLDKVTDKLHKSNGHSFHEVPPAIQELIGISANIDGPSVAAREFGVSVQTATKYRDNKTNEELRDKIESQLTDIRDTAMEKLMLSLGVITPESMNGIKPKIASDIAANMSRVVEKTLPKDRGAINAPTIIFYAPRQRAESDFEVIEVNNPAGN